MKQIGQNKRNKILAIAVFTVLILVLVVIGWNKFQEYIFFHPWHDRVAYQKLQQIDEFKEIRIKNEEVDLSGWFWDIQKEQGKAPAIIFFTGNAQNSSNVLYNYYLAGTMKDVWGDYNLIIVDYPGYGVSKGKPSEESMFKAAKYVFEFTAEMAEVDKNNMVILGYSIGTGVACYCASTNEASGLILVAPYDRVLSLYNDAINIFHGPVRGLASYSFDSVSYAKNIKVPTLIFTSKADEVIDYQHSLDLAGHFSGLEEVVVLEEVNHNGYFSQARVLEGITSFLNKVSEQG